MLSNSENYFNYSNFVTQIFTFSLLLLYKKEEKQYCPQKWFQGPLQDDTCPSLSSFFSGECGEKNWAGKEKGLFSSPNKMHRNFTQWLYLICTKMNTFKFPTGNQNNIVLTCLMRTSNAATKSSCWMWWLITCSKSETILPQLLVSKWLTKDHKIIL